MQVHAIERLKSFGLAAVVFALGWAGIEAYFAVNYRPPFDPASYAMNMLTAFTPPLNADGFRQAPLPADVMASESIRTLFLGDSFTFGHGVPNGSDRFSELLQVRLNNDRSGLRYHIYNAGVSGTEPTRWVGYLKQLLPTYHPQAVFAVFFLRDGTALCTSLACHKEKIASLQSQYGNSVLYRYSYVYRSLADRQMIEAFSGYYESLIKNSYLGNDEQQSRWRQEQASLKQIANLCRENGIAFRLVIFPLLLHLQDYPFFPVENAIAEFAKQNDIPSYSLTPGFLNSNDADLWVAPGDQHPNPLGNRIAADTLYPYLKSALDLLDPRAPMPSTATTR